MNGNDHYEKAEALLRPAVYRAPADGQLYVGPPDGSEVPPEPAQVYRALTEATLAVAFELRTRNILTAQATPGWLNEARVRMGAEPFPPERVVTSLTADVVPAPVDLRCEKRLMDQRMDVRCWLYAGHQGECK